MWSFLFRLVHPRLVRSRAAQLLVVSEVDEAEAALAQHPLDPVATDPLGLRRGVGRDGWGDLPPRLVSGLVRIVHATLCCWFLLRGVLSRR
jgi:hypothetical protein